MEDTTIPIQSKFTFAATSPCVSTGFAKDTSSLPDAGKFSFADNAATSSSKLSGRSLARLKRFRKSRPSSEQGNEAIGTSQAWSTLPSSITSSPSKFPKVKVPRRSEAKNGVTQPCDNSTTVQVRPSSQASYFDDYDPIPSPYRRKKPSNTDILDHDYFDLARTIPLACGRKTPDLNVQTCESKVVQQMSQERDCFNAAKLPDMSSSSATEPSNALTLHPETAA